MQGLWKDKRKHVLKEKIKSLHKKLYKKEDSIDVLEYKTRTDITYDSKKFYDRYQYTIKPIGNEQFLTRVHDRERLFAYGKPLSVNFWHEFGFWSTKARKYAQKKAHHMDRQNIRTYISKGEWDKEIKTHALSKSIAWEVY